MLKASAANSSSLGTRSPPATRFVGAYRKAMERAAGSSSRSISRRLASTSTFSAEMPVTLPDGRLRLATNPLATGSNPRKENNRNGCGCSLRDNHRLARIYGDCVDLKLNQFVGESGQSAFLVVRAAIFDHQIAPVDKAHVRQLTLRGRKSEFGCVN